MKPLTEVEDERRAVDVAHVARRQLEVVRLGAGRRQVADAGVAPRDLLGGVGERVERRHDRVLCRSPASLDPPQPASSAGGGDEQRR